MQADDTQLMIDELARRWGEQLAPRLAGRTAKLGLVGAVGDGLNEIVSPRRRAVSEELAELGIPLETAVDTTAEVKRHAQAVANAYVKLFLENVWRPFQDAGGPENHWTEVSGALGRDRPMAVVVMVAVFQIVLAQ